MVSQKSKPKNDPKKVDSLIGWIILMGFGGVVFVALCQNIGPYSSVMTNAYAASELCSGCQSCRVSLAFCWGRLCWQPSKRLRCGRCCYLIPRLRNAPTNGTKRCESPAQWPVAAMRWTRSPVPTSGRRSRLILPCSDMPRPLGPSRGRISRSRPSRCLVWRLMSFCGAISGR